MKEKTKLREERNNFGFIGGSMIKILKQVMEVVAIEPHEVGTSHVVISPGYHVAIDSFPGRCRYSAYLTDGSAPPVA